MSAVFGVCDPAALGKEPRRSKLHCRVYTFLIVPLIFLHYSLYDHLNALKLHYMPMSLRVVKVTLILLDNLEVFKIILNIKNLMLDRTLTPTNN